MAPKTINNLPVDVMRETITGHVIGIGVGADHDFRSDADLTKDMPPPWSFAASWRGRRRTINIMQVPSARGDNVNSTAMTIGQRASAEPPFSLRRSARMEK